MVMVVQVRFIAAIIVTIVTASVNTLCETMGKEGTVFPLYLESKD